jgi:hypothetical protein
MPSSSQIVGISYLPHDLTDPIEGWHSDGSNGKSPGIEGVGIIRKEKGPGMYQQELGFLVIARGAFHKMQRWISTIRTCQKRAQVLYWVCTHGSLPIWIHMVASIEYQKTNDIYTLASLGSSIKENKSYL